MIQCRQTVKEFQELLLNIITSIQHYSFVCTQLNGSKYCHVSLTIQLNISHLLAHSLNVKQFYLTHRESGLGSNINERVLYIPQSSRTGASLSDCLVSYPGHLLGGGVLPLLQRCTWCILQPLSNWLDILG